MYIYIDIHCVIWKYATITFSLKIEALNVTLNRYHFKRVSKYYCKYISMIYKERVSSIKKIMLKNKKKKTEKGAFSNKKC